MQNKKLTGFFVFLLSMGPIFIVSWTEASRTKKFNNTEMTTEQRMNYAKHLEKPTDLKKYNNKK